MIRSTPNSDLNAAPETDPAAALSDAKRALLARRLQGAGPAASPATVIPRRPSGSQATPSTGQERLWFLHQLEHDSAAYTMYQAHRLTGALDVRALGQALNDVVARHDSLRTTFEARDGKPVPVVAPVRGLALPSEDLRHRSTDTREAAMRDLATRFISAPFDLAAGPLSRFLLLRTRDAEHVFVVAIHHIVADEWSLEVFWRDLWACYAARTTGDVPALPALPIQYPDYAAWQRERLDEDHLAEHVAYWTQKLAGLENLDLPFDRPRTPRRRFAGALRTRLLPAELTAPLHSLRKEHDATLFVLMLAAFQTLLHRYASQDDVTVGVPVTNRAHAEVQDLIGFFLNVLVLRADLSGEPTFQEVLSRTREVVLEALAHQDVPFEKLVETLNPARRLSHHPLFQVMFVTQQEPEAHAPGTALKAERVALTTASSKYDLTLFATESRTALSLTIEYDTDLFDEATIDRMLGHLETLLRGIVSQPDVPIASLPLLTQSERQQLLVDWSAPAPRLAPEMIEGQTLHGLIRAQAAATPEAQAVTLEEESLSYAELTRRSNRLASHLQSLGVGPGTLVGVCLHRSPDLVVSILAVLQAGGAYVPLDPGYPSERLRLLLEDAACAVFLTSRQVAGMLSPMAARVVVVDEPHADWKREQDTPPADLAGSDDLAYVIYTSGSTGRPKGVQVTHRNVVASTLARQTYYRSAPERFLLLSSVAFDSSVAGLFWPLCTGGTLVLPRVRQEQDVTSLLALVRGRKVTHTLCIPSLYAVLLAHAGAEDLGSLRCVIVAGEACPPELIARHGTLAPQAELHNEYGPTEATVWATVHQIQVTDAQARVPIGRPPAHAEVYVLDAHGQPAPTGVPGELFVGGQGISRGYLHRQDLTSARFLRNPFSGDPEARLYRTGDRVRFRGDGVLEFLGRMDDQAKVRGHRIEPGEISAVLAGHPDVREAVVAMRPVPDAEASDGRLLAYVVPKAGARPESTALKSFLKERLPDYMIPSSVLVLQDLPRTPSGKVDTRALPDPDPLDEVTGAPVPPRNELEATLAEIWQAALGVAPVGVHDNFFDLGGDSILSIQIIARMRRAGLRVSPTQLFERQTIAELAATLDVAPPRVEEPLRPDAPHTGIVPLTPIQHWFLDQNLPDANHWNHAIWLSVPESADADRIQRALQHVVDRHDALRTYFEQASDGWTQRVASPAAAHVQVAAHEFSGPHADEYVQVKAAELNASIRLDEPPLLRAGLVRMGPNMPQRLFLSIHHIVVDPISWQTILDDLAAAYRQLGSGNEVALPEPTTTFATWSDALQTFAGTSGVRDDLEFWLEDETDPAPRLPVDHAGGVFTEATAETVVVALNAEGTRALLQDVHAAYGTSAEDLLLAALVRSVGAWTGERDALVGLERHGREEFLPGLDLTRTVGWFTSFFPVRLRLEAAAEVGASIRSIGKQLRRIPGRGRTFGILRYLSADPRVQARLAALPRPEIVFNYVGRVDRPADDASPFRPLGTIAASRGATNTRDHLLEVNSFVTDGRLSMHWSFSTNVHHRGTIEDLAGRFLHELHALIDHSRSPEAGRVTAADFPEAGLSEDDLDRLLNSIR